MLTYVERRRVSRTSATLPAEKAGLQRSPNFGVLSIYAETLSCRMNKFDVVTHLREVRGLGCHPRHSYCTNADSTAGERRRAATAVGSTRYDSAAELCLSVVRVQPGH